MYRPSKLPSPESVIITQASKNDLNAFKQNWADLSNRKFYGDKIYHDTEFFVNMTKEYNSAMPTPVKGVKWKPDCLKFLDKAANELYSKAVSSIRQPIRLSLTGLMKKQIFKERQMSDLLMDCWFMCLENWQQLLLVL